MISKLYEKTLYTIPSPFIIHPIFEYDISKANISILLEEGYITQDQYDYFYKADRNERQIKIGLMQKNDPKIIKVLDEGFKKARYNLVSSNNIQDDEIISIKKDAMFVTRQLSNTIFGHINFNFKNVYSMMIKINKIEFYFNLTDQGYILDAKGINDEVLCKHQSSYLSVLCDIFSMMQSGEYINTVIYIKEFINKYESNLLPIEFYREFNQSSLYRIDSFNSIYYIDIVCDNDIPYINKTYNQSFNREIYKLISMIYFSYMKKPKQF